MADLDALGREDAGTIEVRVYRDGTLICTERCESEDEVVLVVDRWTEQPGVVCEVDDLSVRHRPTDIAGLEPLEGPLPDEER